MKKQTIDELSINTLKMSGIAAINAANSGHPGIVLGAAKIVYTIFTKHLKYDPTHPNWINRDRFILSAGHGSALLYSQLRLLGLLSEADLRKFRKLGSLTPGHPEYGHTIGVESTTGPLGQGIGVAVGIAIAESHLSSKFNEIDHFTYVVCGDGDLQEGVSYESLSIAGRLKLKKLIVIHDSNNIQLDSPVSKTFNENIKLRMGSIGFEYILVEKNTIKEIDKAIKKAKKSTKPTFIEVKTTIGDGTPLAGTSKVHGAPLSLESIDFLKEHLGWKYDVFFVPPEVKKHFKKIIEKNKKIYSKFRTSNELTKFLKNKKIIINFMPSKNVATRVSSGEIISWLNNRVPQLIGGSADLSGSTKSHGADGDFDVENRKGRNIMFGVREFAMGAIANGISLHSKLKVFISTFFTFSDYVKPAIRLASIMDLPVIYIFTHDSILVGEDGPTHEPVEQLAMLRSIPNLDVIRPGDEVEMVAAWESAINRNNKPIVIVASRQDIISTLKTKKTTTPYYVIKNINTKWTLISTGSEMSILYNIAQSLNINLISAPNINNIKLKYDWNHAISVEILSTFGWHKFAKYNIGIDQFGFSGSGKSIASKVSFTQTSLTKRINKIMKN